MDHIIGAKNQRITRLPVLPTKRQAKLDRAEQAALIEEKCATDDISNRGKIDIAGTHYEELVLRKSR